MERYNTTSFFNKISTVSRPKRPSASTRKKWPVSAEQKEAGNKAQRARYCVRNNLFQISHRDYSTAQTFGEGTAVSTESREPVCLRNDWRTVRIDHDSPSSTSSDCSTTGLSSVVAIAFSSFCTQDSTTAQIAAMHRRSWTFRAIWMKILQHNVQCTWKSCWGRHG